jgi:serine/threonine-protein kinase
MPRDVARVSIETYGRYQLLKKLATGGMAQIYLARQAGLEGFEKLVVVKRILPHLAENEDFITMFLDEARIAARLNHPNIVQIFDLGAQDDTFFIAMEYIHGEDVRRVWKQAERLGSNIPLPLILRMIIEACNGLDYAHKKADQSGRPLNIVHRDISPQNILVSFEGHVKVVDFGIAKAADQATVTKSGVLKGKYSYMSPEQAGGEPLDCRTDTFALGVVLYELLTGSRLFKRSNDIQTLNAVMECKVDPPSMLSGRSPPELDAIVMKALAKKREDRYAEARLLGAALEEFLLSRKLPSSTAHLAAYLQEIYADRLAQEAEEGRLQFIESENSKDDGEKATPQSSSQLPKPQTRSTRGDVPRAQGTSSRAAVQRSEATTAERPARSGAISKPRALPTVGMEAVNPGARAGTEVSIASIATETESVGSGKKRLGLAIGLFSLVVALGILAAFALRPGPKPVVTFVTNPPGASLAFDGKALPCRSPCALPGDAAGVHAVVATLTGYHDLAVNVEIPEHGDRSVSFTLEAMAKPVVVPVQPERVTLTFTSEPTGAALSVGNEPRGKTPVEVALVVGDTVAVKLELDGYAAFTDSFEVGAEPVPHSYTLKPLKKEPVAVVMRRPVDPVKRDPVEPRTEPKGVGTVRFAVKPWATVDCPPYKFGDTPFGDKQIPAGEYTCTFSNSELGAKQVKQVRVEPGVMTKVAVTFAN